MFYAWPLSWKPQTKEGAKLAYCISETLRQIEFVLNKNVETREFILDLKSVPFSKKTIDFCLQHPKQVQSYKVYCIVKFSSPFD